MSIVPGVPYNVSITPVNGAGPGNFNTVVNFTQQLSMCSNFDFVLHMLYNHSGHLWTKCLSSVGVDKN